MTKNGIHSVNKGPSVLERIINVLKRGPHKTTQIAAITGIRVPTVSQYLNRNKTLFRKVKQNRGQSPCEYELAQNQTGVATVGNSG